MGHGTDSTLAREVNKINNILSDMMFPISPVDLPSAIAKAQI